MKDYIEVLLYTAFIIAAITALNVYLPHSVLAAYIAYFLLLIALPVYLLQRSRNSLSDSFGLNRGLSIYLYCLILAITAVLSMLSYNPSMYSRAIFSFLVAPVSEETSFRGYILKRMKSLRSPANIIYSGLAFGIAHVSSDSSLPSLIVRIVIGILLAYIFIISGKLLIAISFHTLFNVYSLLHAAGSVMSYLAIASAFILALLSAYDYYKLTKR